MSASNKEDKKRWLSALEESVYTTTSPDSITESYGFLKVSQNSLSLNIVCLIFL